MPPHSSWDTTLMFCVFQCFLLSTVGLPQDGDSEGDSGFVTPDSTTKEKVSRFIEGEDVLSHGKDGLFYLGVIVVVSYEFVAGVWSFYRLWFSVKGV